jgi:hypothetical protein
MNRGPSEAHCGRTTASPPDAIARVKASLWVTRPRAERSSSHRRFVALRWDVWRQDQLRVVDDVADITVVADEADPSVHSSHIR